MAITFATEAIIIRGPLGQTDADTDNPISRTVDIQPMAAAAAWETFGVEVGNGFCLYDEASASGYYELHTQIEWDGKTFAVVAVPRVWDALGPASHVQVFIQEKR